MVAGAAVDAAAADREAARLGGGAIECWGVGVGGDVRLTCRHRAEVDALDRACVVLERLRDTGNHRRLGEGVIDHVTLLPASHVLKELCAGHGGGRTGEARAREVGDIHGHCEGLAVTRQRQPVAGEVETGDVGSADHRVLGVSVGVGHGGGRVSGGLARSRADVEAEEPRPGVLARDRHHRCTGVIEQSGCRREGRSGSDRWTCRRTRRAPHRCGRC